MGGNVRIGNLEAERIDLRRVNRLVVTEVLLSSLFVFNSEFEVFFRSKPLWQVPVSWCASGSTKHLFDRSISDKEFVTFKPSLGDIDLQVDEADSECLKLFLSNSIGREFGTLTLQGFKASAGQFITLWYCSVMKQNLQVDFELVPFKDAKPTKWSMFSHSSAWIDVQRGIKGVFHKYMLRALTTPDLKSIVLLKGKRGKPVETTSTEFAFSVLKGLRRKIEPVLQASEHVWENGYPVYKEIPIEESTFIVQPAQMFEVFFGRPHESLIELDSMWSSVGIVELVKTLWEPHLQARFIVGFANTLWGKGAQKLYRDGPVQDRAEKTAAMRYVIETLDVPFNAEVVEQWREEFYRNWK